MFTVQDMMEMVKQGYKTEEITKLYEIGKEIENPAGAADTGSTGESSGAENETAESQKETGAEAGTESGDPEPAGADVDWKKKAEEMTEKYEALKEKYQQKNIRENIHGGLEDQRSSIEKGLDILSDMIR